MFQSERRTTWITVLCIVLATLGIACLALVIPDVASMEKQYDEVRRRMARVRQSESMMAELRAGTRTECQFDNLDPLIRISKDGSCNGKVQSVRLSRVDLSDHLWGLLLPALPSLKDVAIDSCQGADTLLADLRGMDRWEQLSITETAISDEGMKSMASFPRLKKLELGPKCRGVSPEPLRTNATLESLTLATIDDHWIDVLKTLPKLKTLDIEDADSGLTPDIISRLTKALPQVKVHRVAPIRSSAVREPLFTKTDATSESPYPGLSALLVFWLLHAAIALALSAPILFLGRKRVHWYLWESLAIILPFTVWAILFASPLSVGRKSVANLGEVFFLTIGVAVAALARVAIGSRLSERICASALIALLCVVAAATFFAVPPFLVAQ